MWIGWKNYYLPQIIKYYAVCFTFCIRENVWQDNSIWGFRNIFSRCKTKWYVLAFFIHKRFQRKGIASNGVLWYYIPSLHNLIVFFENFPDNAMGQCLSMQLTRWKIYRYLIKTWLVRKCLGAEILHVRRYFTFKSVPVDQWEIIRFLKKSVLGCYMGKRAVIFLS